MDATKEYAQKAASRAVRRYGMKVAGKAAARYGIIPILTATFPVWGTILAVLAAAMFVIIVLVAGCNQGGLTGLGLNLASKAAGLFGTDVCKSLTFNGGTSGGAGATTSFGGKLTDAEARAQFTAAGVGWNALQPQTSFEGIFQATVTEVVQLKNDCTAKMGSCNVIVTGGTESGHAAGVCSHGNGYKFDVGLNTNLSNYIKTTFTPSGTRSDGAALYTKPGGSAIYALEGNHWDVAVGCSSNVE
jgi:hypothetical protein